MTTQTESVSLADAAKQLETTPLKVLMAIKQGRLVGHEDASGGWQIDGKSLEALLALDPSCRFGAPVAHSCKGCGGGCS